MDGPVGVRVWRGPEIESLHRVRVAVAGAGGTLVGGLGDPSARTYLRSSAKPVQALPLVEEGLVERYGLEPREIAVMAASHNAEPFHVHAVRSILEKGGIEESLLQCGPHEPMGEMAAASLRAAEEEPGPIHNNCSGKHAGMLLVCRAMGWPTGSYRDPDHPLQRRIRERLAELAGCAADALGLAVDGCGVPTFSMPVEAMARTLAALAVADARRAGDRERAIGAVLDAMARHPEYVAGTGRVDTAIMVAHGNRVVVKTGAEGVFCAAIRGHDGNEPRGVALKVADGARRAQDVAIVDVLDRLGVVDPAAAGLAGHARPPLLNRSGEVVGRIDAHLPLEMPWSG